MKDEHLCDLIADFHHRVQACEGVLEHHRNFAATNFPHLALAESEQVLVAESRLSSRDFRSVWKQSHAGKSRHAFAAAGFSDHSERLARFHVQGYATEDLKISERHVKVVDGEQRHGEGLWPNRRLAQEHPEPKEAAKKHHVEGCANDGGSAACRVIHGRQREEKHTQNDAGHWKDDANEEAEPRRHGE